MNIRNVIKSILFGIMWGCTFYTFIGMGFALFAPSGVLEQTTSEYLKQAIFSIIVGIGFTLPSIVYQNKNMPLIMQATIHIGTGMIIYSICAYFAGWLPVNNGISVVIMSILFSLSFSLLIWFFFYLYYKKEAKCINDKLNENK